MQDTSIISHHDKKKLRLCSSEGLICEREENNPTLTKITHPSYVKNPDNCFGHPWTNAAFASSSLVHCFASAKSRSSCQKYFLLGLSWGQIVAIQSDSPHLCHFVLDVVFSCLLRYDLKLTASDWPLNRNYCCFVVLHRRTLQGSGVETKVPYSSLGSYI